MKLTFQFKHKKNTRSGQAPLELVLLLPLLVAMFLTILTVGSVGLTHATVAIESNQAAWETRHELNEGRMNVNGTDVVSLILKPNSQDIADAGVSNGEAEIELKSFLPRLLDTLAPAKHEVTALSGAWDHRVIDFVEEDDHDPLELGTRVMVFRGNPRMSKAFQPLALMSQGTGTGTGGGVEAASQAFSLVPKSSSTNSNGITDLTREITNKARELQQEIGKIRPNFGKINQLRKEINKLKGQIAKIKQANKHIGNARQ